MSLIFSQSEADSWATFLVSLVIQAEIDIHQYNSVIQEDTHFAFLDILRSYESKEINNTISRERILMPGLFLLPQ